MRLSIRPLSAAVVTALTAVSLIVPSGAASAETVRTDDATGDVWEVLLEGDRERPEWEPAGSIANTDIVGTVADHRPRRISFTTTYADLLRSDDAVMVVLHRIRIDQAPDRTLQVVRLSGARAFATIFGPRKEIRCRGLAHEIDFRANTVSASFPRRCIGEPESFRHTSWASTGTGWETRRTSDDRTYVDNGLGPGHAFRDFSEPVTRG